MWEQRADTVKWGDNGVCGLHGDTGGMLELGGGLEKGDGDDGDMGRNVEGSVHDAPWGFGLGESEGQVYESHPSRNPGT